MSKPSEPTLGGQCIPTLSPASAPRSCRRWRSSWPSTRPRGLLADSALSWAAAAGAGQCDDNRWDRHRRSSPISLKQRHLCRLCPSGMIGFAFRFGTANVARASLNEVERDAAGRA